MNGFREFVDSDFPEMEIKFEWSGLHPFPFEPAVKFRRCRNCNYRRFGEMAVFEKSHAGSDFITTICQKCGHKSTDIIPAKIKKGWARA